MPGRGRTGSMSSVEESKDTKVHFDDLDEPWGDVIVDGAMQIKRAGIPEVKKVVIKGGAHQSSTVPEHTEIVSIQLRDKNEQYIGSLHIDKEGKVFPNTKIQDKINKRKK